MTDMACDWIQNGRLITLRAKKKRQKSSNKFLDQTKRECKFTYKMLRGTGVQFGKIVFQATGVITLEAFEIHVCSSFEESLEGDPTEFKEYSFFGSGSAFALLCMQTESELLLCCGTTFVNCWTLVAGPARAFSEIPKQICFKT